VAQQERTPCPNPMQRNVLQSTATVDEVSHNSFSLLYILLVDCKIHSFNYWYNQRFYCTNRV